MRKIIKVIDLLKDYNASMDKLNIISYGLNKKKRLSVDSENTLLYLIQHNDSKEVNKLKVWVPNKTLQGTLNMCFRRTVQYTLSDVPEQDSPLTFMGPVIVLNNRAKVSELHTQLLKRVQYKEQLDYLYEFKDLTIGEWEEA